MIDRRLLKPGTRQLGLPAIILVLAIIFAVSHPNFATLSNLQNIARQASILAIVAFGQMFPVLSGGLDISLGANVAAVSVLTALTSTWVGLEAAFLTGILFGGLVGAMNGTIGSKFHIHPLLVTLGSFTALRGFALSVSGGVPISNLPPDYTYLGRGFLGPFPIPFVFAVVVFVLGGILLSRTRFGRYTYAIGGNEEAALISGINVFRYKTLAYVFCGLLAGLTGVLLSSRVGSGEPNLGLELNLESITAVLVGGVAFGGGRGRLRDVLQGVVLLSILSNGLNFSGIQYFTQQIIIGAILIISVIVDRYRREELRAGLS